MTSKIKSHSNERDLGEWLYYLENLHTSEIDMGLTRIGIVAKTLGVDLSFAQVITVAGTNGKGTTCAFIENALLAKNKTVAVYSSPHIKDFNERLRFNKTNVDDQPLIIAFEKIEQARADISLTYYEFTTLAALLIIMDVKPEVVILEVGLGGRLDATNIIDADIAVITTVDLDHQAFLGNDRESIGFEKAGIMRAEQTVVIGDPEPPKSVLHHAQSLNVYAHIRNDTYSIANEPVQQGDCWSWQSALEQFTSLPRPHIPKDNVATGLMILQLLSARLSVEFHQADVINVINETRVAGRTEKFIDGCDVMLDVGHNPLAARYLAQTIAQMNYDKVIAVAGMLADKDISSTLNELTCVVDTWHVADLHVPRGAKAEQLQKSIADSTNEIFCFDNVIDAYKMASHQSDNNSLVLVFGSFYTVAEVRSFLIAH